MQDPRPKSKKMKTIHVTDGVSQHDTLTLNNNIVASVTNYTYSASNILARKREGLHSFELLFDRPHSFAVLETRPSSRGHCVLVLKAKAATWLEDIQEEVLTAGLRDLQVLVRAIQAATGCQGIRVQQDNGPAAGQTVPHLHFHVIPCYNNHKEAAAGPAGLLLGIKNQQAPAMQSDDTQRYEDNTPTILPTHGSVHDDSDRMRTTTTDDDGPSSWQHRHHEVSDQDSQLELGVMAARIRNHLPSYTYTASGLYVWARNSEAMEKIGASLQSCGLGSAGTVLLLNGHLGAGKSTICRGFVRAACKDQTLDVPSPTFLLCLSYSEDQAYDHSRRKSNCTDARVTSTGDDGGAERKTVSSAGLDCSTAGRTADDDSDVHGGRTPMVHHMDPYRLGAKADKMAGLIDFEAAFQQDVCLIEWPDRMPAEVMKLPMKGVTIIVSGTGIQGAGRLVHIQALTPEDPSAQVLEKWRSDSALPEPTVSWGHAGSLTTLSDDADAKSAGSGSHFKEEAGEYLMAAGVGAIKSTARAMAGMKMFPTEDPGQWLVLGIESSCDDTAAAVVCGDGSVKSHCIASQAGLHEQYGGVKPDVARDAHAKAIQSTVETCLSQAGIRPEALTAVAATIGPGLSLCLQVGVQHALTLAARHRLPFIPVHHMEAHAMMTRLPSLNPTPTTFPALIMLVSGGHNMLVLSEGVGKHRIMGTTLDDSVGECFDKIARLMGITVIPGGPHLEKLAEEGEDILAGVAAQAAAEAAAAGTLSPSSCQAAGVKVASKLISQYEVTMPMQSGAHRNSCNFSFSGIKTSVAKLIEEARVRLGLPAQLYSGPGAVSTAGDKILPQSHQQQQSANNVKLVHAAPTSGDSGESADSADKQLVSAQLHRETCLIAAGFQRVAVRFLQQRTRRALQWLAEDARQQFGGSSGRVAAAIMVPDSSCSSGFNADAGPSQLLPAAAGSGSNLLPAYSAAAAPPVLPPAVTCLVVAGGVAANRSVRTGLEAVAAEFCVPCICPPVQHCTDNGLMVAWTGVERLKLGLYRVPPEDREEAIRANVDVLPRWPIGPMDPRSAAGMKYVKAFH
ncbi:hypothetical protein CEUSTIGMA_g5941.t1 [Chlamydomonas eustigma]|uniref:Glycoprotease 1 n=1 Tax=Chlamydomonas eustigma TaxID=1157962 RepID=A0A250X6I8_9CHLO|nr:hypothetical protein CEUSTIGMA_g5941.t1 [Chlamydomonas eustigma]|eukprot:GAX78502.1 hypothetical protein CEUSTIGMA_g5941.t1 [Chlamydomonas eustigma]